MRSLLNDLSTVEIVLLCVGGAALLAVGGVILAAFPGLRDSPFEESRRRSRRPSRCCSG
jgi:hypothetical protein